VRRGTRFETGDPVGTVNRFSHVHLNVGPPGEEVNPLLMRLPNADDSVPPTIPPRGIEVVAEDGTPFRQRLHGRLLVSGRVQIIIEAWDRTDASLPRRRLGVFRVGYQLLDEHGVPIPGFETPRETQRYDRMALDATAPLLVFAPGSGIPFYGSRVTRFRYRATTTYKGGRAEPGVLDTTRLTEGAYVLRAFVADVAGNEARVNRDLPLAVVHGPAAHGSR
jgi:hypothetical protein